MSKPAFLDLDTKDDRREVHTLLRHLSPARLLEFLSWCCSQVRAPNRFTEIGPSKAMRKRAMEAWKDTQVKERLDLEVFFDFWVLCSQHGLDAQAALQYLQEMVRGNR